MELHRVAAAPLPKSLEPSLCPSKAVAKGEERLGRGSGRVAIGQIGEKAHSAVGPTALMGFGGGTPSCLWPGCGSGNGSDLWGTALHSLRITLWAVQFVIMEKKKLLWVIYMETLFHV